MARNNIEPGLLKVFRIFTGIAVIYFALMVGYYVLETGELVAFSQIQIYLNLATNLVLVGYLSWPWLRRKLKKLYLPLALIVATLVPIVSNALLLPGQHADDPYFVITRSWSVFPSLFVPLVLIAWQYRYRVVILFLLFTGLIDLSIVLAAIGNIDLETLVILAVPFIRAFAFGTVGHIVSQSMATQRAQRKELILANVKLSQHANTLEQLATSRERNRLARELHDTLAHTLSGLTVNLEALKFVLSPDQAEVRAMLDHALQNTRDGLTETRRALKDLRSKQLEDLGLEIAIRNLARDAASRADLELELAISADLSELTPQVEQCIFRVAQEALENVVKHASARQVSVRLAERNGAVSMTIADDGAGFALSDVDFSEELGIKGMHERAGMAGGRLKVSSAPGEGTTIDLVVKRPYGQSVDL